MAERLREAWRVDKPNGIGLWIFVVKLRSMTNLLGLTPSSRQIWRVVVLAVFAVFGVGTDAFAVVQSRADTLLYVGFEWPDVGSQLGDNYDEFFRTPVSQNVMTRQLRVRIARGTMETALAMLQETGFAVKEGSANPQPSELTPGTRYALRGRLVEFLLDTRGRNDRRVEVKLAIRWDVLALSSGRVVYTKEFRAESETRLDGDRFGSYFTATTQAFEEVLAELRLDQQFVSLLAAGGR